MDLRKIASRVAILFEGPSNIRRVYVEFEGALDFFYQNQKLFDHPWIESVVGEQPKGERAITVEINMNKIPEELKGKGPMDLLLDAGIFDEVSVAMIES